jgi:hypothetical protein
VNNINNQSGSEEEPRNFNMAHRKREQFGQMLRVKKEKKS